MCYYPECNHVGACSPAVATTLGNTCKTLDGNIIIFARCMWSPDDCRYALMLGNENPCKKLCEDGANEQGYIRRYLENLSRTCWIKKKLAHWTDEEIITYASHRPSIWERLQHWWRS